MAQPKTQDNQKVFQSTLEKFSSFVGGVENVSSSKNMSEIYDNMTKLFDVFTRGALTAQGANSEILLRNVYRSLNDDFLKIIQDTDAVEKIAEVMKDKQESIKPEEADKALVSETTKKVVKQTLDPNDCDPMSVILDFTDELQTAILQVKLNLSREYERRKLEHAKSIEGQQEDLDRLNKEFQEQNDTMVTALEEMTKTQTENKDEDLERLEELLGKFDDIPDDGYVKEDADKISSDLDQVEKSLSKVKFNPEKVSKNIQSTTGKKSEQPTRKVEQEKKQEKKPKQAKAPDSEKKAKTEKPKEVKKESKKETKKPEPTKKPEAKKPPLKKPEAKKPEPISQKKPDSAKPPSPVAAKPKQEQKPALPQQKLPEKVQPKTPEKPKVQEKPEQPQKVSEKPQETKKPIEKKQEQPKETRAKVEEQTTKEVQQTTVEEVGESSEATPSEEVAWVEQTQVEQTQEQAQEQTKWIEQEKPQPKTIAPEPAKSNFNDLKAIKAATPLPEVQFPEIKKEWAKKPISPLKPQIPSVVKKPALKKFKDTPKKLPVKTSILKLKSTSAKATKPIKVAKKQPLAVKKLPPKEKTALQGFGTTGFTQMPPPPQPKRPMEQLQAWGSGMFRKIQESKPVQALKQFKQNLAGGKPATQPVQQKKMMTLPHPKLKKWDVKPTAPSPVKPIQNKKVFQQKVEQKKQVSKPAFSLGKPIPKAKSEQKKKQKVWKKPILQPKESKKQTRKLQEKKQKKGKTFSDKMPKISKQSSSPSKSTKKQKYTKAQKKLGKSQLAGLSKIFSDGLGKGKSAKKGFGKKLSKGISVPGKKGKVSAGNMIQNMLSSGAGTGKGKASKKKSGMKKPLSPKAKAQPTKGTKLGGKPNGKTCTCPLCGNVHQHGNGKTQDNEKQGGKNKPGKVKPLKKSKSKKQDGSGNDLSTDQVQETLGLMGNNVIKLTKDKKFRGNFEINYKPIQKTMQKQMELNDKDESVSHDYFQKTKANIKKLKSKKGSSSLLHKMMSLGLFFVNILWIVLGGLIIIALLRKGWQMWKKAYMPKVKSDPVTFTIFGFKIPIAGEIVDAFKGIRNFILVGLPNWWTRISTTCGNLYENLFGKKGCLRDFEQIKATMWRLFAAWVVGQTKEAVGKFAKWLGKVLSVIPFVGPLLSFLCELIPEVYAFITNRLMKEWANGQAEAERHEKKARSLSQMKQKGAGKTIKGLMHTLLKKSAKIKPIAPPEAIPFMQTPKKASKVRKPMSIMRNVKIKKYHSGEGAAFGANARKEYEVNMKDWGGYHFDKKTGNFTRFFTGKQQEKGGAAHTRVSNAVMTTDRNMEGKNTFEKLMILSQEPWTPTKRKRAEKILVPEYHRLIKYATLLGRSLEEKYRRFGEQNLYDPDKGWNPNLRVTNKELVTKLPFEPFSELSNTPIAYGSEAEPEDQLPEGDRYGKGYMPFKWKWNGGVIVRDPQEWELHRVFKAIKWWGDLYELVSGPTKWWKGQTIPPDKLIDIVLGNLGSSVNEASMRGLSKNSEDWRLNRQFMGAWAMASNPYNQNPMNYVDGEVEDGAQHYSQGLFPQFYKQMSEGRLTKEGFKVGNILAAGAMYQLNKEESDAVNATRGLNVDQHSANTFIGEASTWVKRFTVTKAMTGFNSNTDIIGSVMKNDANFTTDKDGTVVDVVKLGNLTEFERTWNETGWDDEYRRGGGKKALARNHRTMRSYAGALLSGKSNKRLSAAYNESAYKRLAAHLDQPYVMKSTGMKFKFEDFLRVIKGAQLGKIYIGGSAGKPFIVANPVQKAGNILARITHDVHFIPAYSGQESGKNYFYSLFHHLIDFMHLKLQKGYNKKDLFEQFTSDDQAKNVLARLILQYFYNVWCKWYYMEQALQESMRNMDGKSRDKFTQAFNQLGELFDFQNIMTYLATHVRLPNAKIHVIDYLNASEEQVPFVDKYRKEADLRPLSDKKSYLQLLDSEYQIALATSKHTGGSLKFSPKSVTDAMKRIVQELKKADYEFKYTGDAWYRDSLIEKWSKFADLANTMGILADNDAKITGSPDKYIKTIDSKLSPDQRRKLLAEQEKKRKEEEAKRRLQEAAKRRARQRALARRRERLAVQEANNKMLEKMRNDEKRYQEVLQKLIAGTKVSDDDMKALGKEVSNVKQEAENKIQHLSREERELRLAVIRGDNVSEKTFIELKDTASGLQMSLQDYMLEVRKIPTGSIVGVQSVPTGQTKVVNTQDTDAVDLAS